MIYEREILRGQQCPSEYKENLLELLVRINKVRDAYGRPMIVTSGFRSKKEHERIYRKQIEAGEYVPWGSKHLTCQAIDIYDPDNKLRKWCEQNDTLLREIGVWLEEDQGNWIHFQTVPFASYKEGGRIWFKPF